MILVDTSVWIAFFRGIDDAIVRRLNQLLDESQVAISPVTRLEILAGAARKDRNQLKHLLSALPLFPPPKNLWQQMETWVLEARGAGQHFSLPDMMIAVTAREEDCRIWSLDQDFARMARLGWVDLFQARRKK